MVAIISTLPASQIQSDFLYRIDSTRNLISIWEEGFKCQCATRVPPGWDTETGLAREKGLAVPPSHLLESPRAYFFSSEAAAIEHQRVFSYPHNLKSVLRFSRRAPALNDDALIFSDGCFREPYYAVYVVCAGVEIGTPVISGSFIEVRQPDGTWVPLGSAVTELLAQQAREGQEHEKRIAAQYAQIDAARRAPASRPGLKTRILDWLYDRSS